MSREEMEQLGWDSCDIVLVTGDAYVDHPSFGMAVIGRTLEAQGFRVGIIAQPDWQRRAFKALGKPNLFWGVTAGNMDSMINRYTADRKIRSDDAYTPGAEGNRARPRRHRLQPALPRGLQGRAHRARRHRGSLRRIAHYDYWSDKVRRSIVVDSKCDLLLYGNAERALVEMAHRLARASRWRRSPTCAARPSSAAGRRRPRAGSRSTPPRWTARQGGAPHQPLPDHQRAGRGQGASCAKEDATKSKLRRTPRACSQNASEKPLQFVPNPALVSNKAARETVIRLPSYEQVKSDPVLYAHANRVLHLETNPATPAPWCRRTARATARDVWLNPPPIPLTTAEMDWVFDLPYARSPHPRYADEHGSHDGATKIPAWEMIRFSVNIMRGCFGGCTFCSITEHEGRIIQSRSEDSIIREIEEIRDKVRASPAPSPTWAAPRPTCTAWAARARDRGRLPQAQLRLPRHLPEPDTDHGPLIKIYRRRAGARASRRS
jgi:uncharacterized radical SAM protein YgiQ